MPKFFLGQKVQEVYINPDIKKRRKVTKGTIFSLNDREILITSFGKIIKYIFQPHLNEYTRDGCNDTASALKGV